MQLAISPQPRVLGESISVQSGSQLAVKVEGVIQHGKRPGLFRHVSGVVVTVSSQLQARSANNNHDTKVRLRYTMRTSLRHWDVLLIASISDVNA